MRTGKILALLVVLVFASTSAMAAGFRLPEAGVKPMGMGFAFVAQADDPSAIYFNPAGLTQLEGHHFMAGGIYIRENGGEFDGTTPLTLGAVRSEAQKDLDFFVPNAYWTWKATPRLAIGVGLFVPFGLAQEYQDKETSIFRNQVSRVEIQTFVLNPSVAWKVNDFLSVGAGFDFMYGSAELTQRGVVNVGFPLNIFRLKLEGEGTALGYNFGVLITPLEHWKVGFSYRSRFTLDIENADVDVRDINSTVGFVPPGGFTAAQVFGGTSFDTEADTKIKMPATATVGVAYVRDRLTVEADVDWTFWDRFNKLAINIEGNNPLLPDAVRPEEWKDVLAVRVGLEYRVTDPLALRVGFVYDQTPIPDHTLSPLLPGADRFNYTAGVGYKYRSWTFDLAYLYVDKDDRSVNNQTPDPPGSFGQGFNGEWSGDAHLVGLDVGYAF